MIKRTLLAFGLGVVFNAQAATLTGELSFVKKPPFVGILYAKGGEGPKAAELDQANKVFDKKVVIVGQNGEITFKNSDEFQHNIFANDPNSGVKFDVGLMNQGQTTKVTANWSENTLTRIGCKIHPKMRSYIANVNSDTYQVLPFTKKQKSYSIELDAGSATTFVLQIPKYDPVEVTLSPGEAKSVEVLYKGKLRANLSLTLK
jgi:plastocyanin